MSAVTTFTIEPDELLGLSALAALETPAHGGDASAVTTARALMHTALAGRLAEGRPAVGAVGRDGQAARRRGRVRGRARAASGGAVRKESVAAALAVAVLIALWGGYARGWAWTGFRSNGQLWDWLNLLLLPVVVAVIPVWMQYKAYFGRVRRGVYWAVVAAWTAFVIAGYLIPIGWTGFRGVTLWQWLSLLVIPVALAITMALTSMRIRPAAALRALRPYQKFIMAALIAGWVVTLVGGYALGWTWTGYTDPANDSLWAWLQMLLVPLLLPTVLQPVLLKWITGDVTDRAGQAAPAPAAVGGAEKAFGRPQTWLTAESGRV